MRPLGRAYEWRLRISRRADRARDVAYSRQQARIFIPLEKPVHDSSRIAQRHAEQTLEKGLMVFG
jgi:hypothetical protein